jgi:hypothetical protein
MFSFNSSIAIVSIVVNIFWTDDSLVLVKENFFFLFSDEINPELASREDRLPLACSEKQLLLEHRKLQSNIKTGKPASRSRGPFRGHTEYPVERPCEYGFGIW